MEIEFEVDKKRVYDPKLVEKFCEKLVQSLRQDIVNQLVPAKFPILEKNLINAVWIPWQKKPKSIDVESLIKKTLMCITWTKRDTTYRVYIDTKEKMPYTNGRVTLEQIARFIDKGNNVSQSTSLYSKVFNHYQENIKEFWEMYKEFGNVFDWR